MEYGWGVVGVQRGGGGVCGLGAGAGKERGGVSEEGNWERVGGVACQDEEVRAGCVVSG